MSERTYTHSESHQVTALRTALAGVLEAEERWTDAALVLMAVPLESTHRCAV